MSIPQIFLTASGSSVPTTVQNDSQRIQSFNFPTTSKEHIRERLNLHVKKRIQGQDPPHYSMSSPSPTASLYSSASTLKPAYPFLVTGTNQTSSKHLFTFSQSFARPCRNKFLQFPNLFLLHFRCYSINGTRHGLCKFVHFRGIQLQIGCWPINANPTNWSSHV